MLEVVAGASRLDELDAAEEEASAVDELSGAEVTLASELELVLVARLVAPAPAPPLLVVVAEEVELPTIADDSVTTVPVELELAEPLNEADPLPLDEAGAVCDDEERSEVVLEASSPALVEEGMTTGIPASVELASPAVRVALALKLETDVCV